jgi:hypothetical protein
MNHKIYAKLKGIEKHIFATAGRHWEPRKPDYNFDNRYSYGSGSECHTGRGSGIGSPKFILSFADYFMSPCELVFWED